MRFSLEVRVWRGAILESRHDIHAALSDPAGSLAAATAEPGRVTSFRSAAKPFQLLPLVERGHAERWGFGDEQLAVMAASHTGSPYHLELVAGILGRLGLSDRDLACGFHEPLDPVSLADIRAHPESRSPLYNNCSGKHAGMLCLALSEGWPTSGYQLAAHPVQQLMRRTVGELAGLDPGSLEVAVDGCSVSVFGLPLESMARAYARLAAARDRGDARERALDRIRRAMCGFPRATGGEGRLSSELMEKTGGRLVAKGGAEALECAGLTAKGLGLALKCEDGAGRAIGPALVALLEWLGELDAGEVESLAAHARPVVKNVAGLECGRIEAALEVSVAARGS